ncbi:hypothetical protein WD019_17515 [Fictibacillus sp. Mic-4]|uniref:DUF6933 domain-containing protein n=1 Tax=Fictibacillus sp. Mic-4 TaxID=3132826 RepID=UPI003CF39D71
MLTIQCTKKLADELMIDLKQIESGAREPFYSWHAHLFLFNRRKCVLLMNNITRYNFVLLGLKKNDFRDFSKLVVTSIAENLVADGICEMDVDEYIKKCGTAIYTKTSERSILSQMNEMISVSKHWMEEDRQSGTETNLYELNRYLNRFVMLQLPKTYSGETMRDAFLQRKRE